MLAAISRPQSTTTFKLSKILATNSAITVREWSKVKCQIIHNLKHRSRPGRNVAGYNHDPTHTHNPPCLAVPQHSTRPLNNWWNLQGPQTTNVLKGHDKTTVTLRIPNSETVQPVNSAQFLSPSVSRGSVPYGANRQQKGVGGLSIDRRRSNTAGTARFLTTRPSARPHTIDTGWGLLYKYALLAR